MWGKAIRIARINGIDIKIDASWLLIAAMIVWSLSTTYFPTKLPGASQTALLFISFTAMIGLFGSLILHELAHALVARHFGLDVPGITLFVFGGVAELQSEPTSAATEFWIAIAGPAASLCLALVFWFSAGFAAFFATTGNVAIFLGYLAVINLILALFNLLPAFPMDGGRVMRAWLWWRSGNLLASTAQAVRISTVFGYGLMALGTYTVFSGATASGIWPILIGLFLLAASRSSLARLEADLAFDGRTVATFMTPDPWTAEVDQSLSEVVNRVFLEHAITFAPVMEGDTLVGYIDTQIVRRIDRENWTTTTVEDVVENLDADNTVPHDMRGLDLMTQMAKTGRRKFMVVENDTLVGVITLSDMLAVLNVSREIGYGPRTSYGRMARD